MNKFTKGEIKNEYLKLGANTIFLRSIALVHIKKMTTEIRLGSFLEIFIHPIRRITIGWRLCIPICN